MAEDRDDAEKSEEASQYRLDEYRKKGDVASSKELNSVLLIAGTFLTLILLPILYDWMEAFAEKRRKSTIEETESPSHHETIT